jgi:ribose-phosphate pyrophosphokinase
MRLFGIGQTSGFAERLARQLGVALATHEERDFEDGEFKIRSLEAVNGVPVVVCQSLAADAKASSNDKLMRLLVFCGALRDAGAVSVTVLVPYLAYWRKDRRTQLRDPITTSYVSRVMEAVGIDAVVTIDPHGVATFENAFRCRKVHLEGGGAFAAHFADVAASSPRVVVLSPDAGGQARARAFAAQLGARLGRAVEYAFMEKQRSGGRVSGELFAGDVRDALVIVYDDLISTGGTIARAASAARARGAGVVHAAATHALLVGNAVALLNDAGLGSLTVMDTVEDVRERCAPLRCPWHVLDAAAVFAAAREQWAIRDRSAQHGQ